LFKGGLKFSAKITHATSLAEYLLEHNMDEIFVLPQGQLFPSFAQQIVIFWRKYIKSSRNMPSSDKVNSYTPPLHQVLLRKNGQLKQQTNLSAAQRKVLT